MEARDAGVVSAQIDVATRELGLAVEAIREGRRWGPKALIRATQHTLERGLEVLSAK